MVLYISMTVFEPFLDGFMFNAQMARPWLLPPRAVYHAFRSISLVEKSYRIFFVLGSYTQNSLSVCMTKCSPSVVILKFSPVIQVVSTNF